MVLLYTSIIIFSPVLMFVRFGSMQSLLLRENERANRDKVEVREDLFERAGLNIKLTVDNSSETGGQSRRL